MKRIKLFRKLKYAIQRIKRGYSDLDVMDMDVWFLNIMPKMLEQLRDTTHSAPLIKGTTYMTCYDEWRKILDRMIFLLHDMNEDTCSFKNKYEKEFFDYLDEKYSEDKFKDGKFIKDEEFNKKHEELVNDYYGQESIKNIHINLRKNEFFDLFSKYFYDLWD